ncbi:MAG: hypothetical protein H6559_37885 [Lewinellaceae bacterium]|nr:hypothetical protein [Lewinellaceae bacterium]
MKQKNKKGPYPQNSEYGVVYTKAEVVRFMLDLVGYKGNENLSGLGLLEPSAGDGAFVEEILSRLIASSRNHGFHLSQALSGLCFIELENTTALELRELVENKLNPELGSINSKAWAKKS